MFEIKATGLDHLADAIFALAAAMTQGASAQQAPEQKSETPGMPAQPASPATPAVPATPVAQQAAAPASPAAQTTPTTSAVPTSQQTYSLDDLARAGMTLMDSGRQADLQGLLKQFGVEALPALPQEQYGAFATALRGLGAQI